MLLGRDWFEMDCEGPWQEAVGLPLRLDARGMLRVPEVAVSPVVAVVAWVVGRWAGRLPRPNRLNLRWEGDWGWVGSGDA